MGLPKRIGECPSWRPNTPVLMTLHITRAQGIQRFPQNAAAVVFRQCDDLVEDAPLVLPSRIAPLAAPLPRLHRATQPSVHVVVRSVLAPALRFARPRRL